VAAAEVSAGAHVEDEDVAAAPSAAVDVVEIEAACAEDAGTLHLSEAPASSAAAKRRVTFSEASAEILEVPAYSQIYGLHPSEFVFDRDYHMVPTGGVYGFTDLLAALETTKSVEVDEREINSCWDSDSDDDGDEDGDDAWTEIVELRFC